MGYVEKYIFTPASSEKPSWSAIKKTYFLCVLGGMEIPNDLGTTAVSVGISVSVSEAEKKTKQILWYWLALLPPGSGSLPGPLDFSLQKHIAGLPPHGSTNLAYLQAGAHNWFT